MGISGEVADHRTRFIKGLGFIPDMEKFHGIIPPMLTPFTRDGRLYEDGLRNLLDFLMKNGVHGLFICGTYGCGPAMTIDERKRVAEIVMENVKGRLDVIVHVGSSTIDFALELAKHAEDIGADAIASVPPFYYAYDEESVFSFYKKLLSSVDIPVFVYNNPFRTGIRISPDLLSKLADEGVAGIKDSGFDLVKFYEYKLNVKRKDFIFLIGTEALMLPAMLAGARGCVSGSANVFPKMNVDLYRMIMENKIREAVDKQLQIIEARRILHLAPTIPACYEVLRMQGIDAGYPRPPFLPLSRDQVKMIKDKLVKLNLIQE